jgi:hypothetical protein
MEVELLENQWGRRQSSRLLGCKVVQLAVSGVSGKSRRKAS